MEIRMRLHVCLCVLVLLVALSEGLRGWGPKDCCFRFQERAVPKGRVLSYVKTRQQCSVPAVRLKTLLGRHVCARFSASWVRDLMKHLDTKTSPGNTSGL
ncbi:C-C motif chemokine 3-like [Dunckerocampus dactyliophorus]|uniref:C-C motif chemokine 3-like n=1 Tax=Dunckerocampus dactyliophorus TaxID=161453 RepID=UPI0024059041|nr:C-C motif chemokine 3-like [Dunckerocampus dactyliophorus]